MLFRAMEESLAHEDDIPQDHRFTEAVVTVANAQKFLQSIWTHDIAGIADEFVDEYGSYRLRQANNALNAWRKNWDARRTWDVFGNKSGSFSHPMNFWLLAKLFITVHFLRNRLPDSDTTGHGEAKLESADLRAFFKAKRSAHADDRIQAQIQVINWLMQIRKHQTGRPLASQSFLSEVMDGH